MRKIIKYFLLVFWLIAASVTFSAIWVRTPALWFITLPRFLWNFLVDYLNISCCESMADLEFYIGIFFGFLFSLIILAIFTFVVNQIKKSTNPSE